MTNRKAATEAEIRAVEASLEAGPLYVSFRCESVSRDEVGWIATFSGKPNVVGNRVSFPVSDEWAQALVPGTEYLFSMGGRVSA